jgi:Signal transduction histidine kinase, nitrate/nitrite-specific
MSAPVLRGILAAGGGGMLRRLRWLTIILPVIFVVVIELLSDTFLDELLPFSADALLIAVVVLAAGIVMSTTTFRVVDRLADELRERNAELEARNAAARALHSMSVAITALADTDQVLAGTAANARELLATDVAWVTRIGSDGEERLVATSGAAEAFDASGGQPGEDADRFVRAPYRLARLAAPLQRGGSTIGSLAVGTRSSRRHDVDDLETLSSLANQAAVAVENDRLQRELRTLAISAERERIAREMHDGLAQVLGYVNTKSQAVEQLLDSGRTAEATIQMAELAAAARSIYVDLREAILGLSTPLGEGPGGSAGARAGEADLAIAVGAYLDRFGEAAKLAVSLEATDGAGGEDLSPEAVANLFRIVQEALTNVRKHAAARRVVVRIERAQGAIAVTVEDDGRGFDPAGREDPSDWPHFGRETIRQRAAAIGGKATWDSAPGRGTRVRVIVPTT